VGDFVAQVAYPIITRSGFVNSRHLDDKAGVAAVLTAFKALLDAGTDLEVGVKLLITISEEVGHGASSGITHDIAELLSIDAAVVADGQTTTETGVTVAMQDLHGPFDYHLTRGSARSPRPTASRSTATCSGTTGRTSLPRWRRGRRRGLRCSGSGSMPRTGTSAPTSTPSWRPRRLLALYLQTPLTFRRGTPKRRGR
jgi:hypothetical protein